MSAAYCPSFSCTGIGGRVLASDPVREQPFCLFTRPYTRLCQPCYSNSGSRNAGRGLQHLTLRCFASLLTCNNALAARHRLVKYEQSVPALTLPSCLACRGRSAGT